MTKKIGIIVIALGAIFVLYGLYELSCNDDYEEVPNEPVALITYLEQLEKNQQILLDKIDSIELSKTEKINTYYKTKLIYDTIRTTIDTMPPLDATKLLLSKSRQLTNKGIE